MCGSMVDIRSATAEIRRGKKRKKEEETTGQRYNVRMHLLCRAAIARFMESYSIVSMSRESKRLKNSRSD